MFRISLFVALMIVSSSSALAFLDRVQELQIVGKGDQFVDIQFAAVSGASRYTLLIGTNSVANTDQSYNLPPVSMGANTNYRVKNLLPDGTYFMRVFGSSADDRSEFLSNELTVNMRAIASDISTPEVSSIDVLNVASLQINFTQAMDFNLLEGKVGVRKLIDNREVEILKTEILNNSSLKFVFADSLSRNAEFQLFIQPSLKSVEGDSIDNQEYVQNFIIEEDTPDFFETANLDFQPISAQAFDSESFEVEFSKSVQYVNDIAEKFTLFSVSDPNLNLDIQEVLLNQVDDKKILLVTKGFDANDSYIVEVSDLNALDGDALLRDNMQIEVNSQQSQAGVDQSQLTDVTNLQATLSQSNPSKVDLNFQNPESNSASKFQIFIKSDDGSRFDLLKELSNDLSKVALNIGTPSSNAVELKVVSVYESGNQSEGVITRLLIPETGPGSLFATLFGSSLLGWWIHRRRK